MVQALVQQDALESTLAAASADLVAALLQHVRRQLSIPQRLDYALLLVDCLLNSCPASLSSDGPTVERLQQLHSALAEELRTQEQLLELSGLLGALTVTEPSRSL